jgi:hypothetical protein
MMGKESEKCEQAFDLDGTFWISVDFSGRKKHVKRKLNVRKKNLKASILFLGSR